MQTSNFANNARHDLRGISIARYPDKRSGFNGAEFPPLFPSAQLLNAAKNGHINWAGYTARYQKQLSALNPQITWDLLHELAEAMGFAEPILLCYESAKTLDTQPCHRRLVAGWFEMELGVVVPEWSKP